MSSLLSVEVADHALDGRCTRAPLLSSFPTSTARMGLLVGVPLAMPFPAGAVPDLVSSQPWGPWA